ncbi:hypothetical protein ACJ67_06895 [Methylophilus sp. TWE2]|nr:hypothetical protein ACJ67_06895 [Methylophilus sp. TWE2]
MSRQVNQVRGIEQTRIAGVYEKPRITCQSKIPNAVLSVFIKNVATMLKRQRTVEAVKAEPNQWSGSMFLVLT